MTVFNNINRLASYGLKTGLIEREDLIYVKNQLLCALGLDGFESSEQAAEVTIMSSLKIWTTSHR